MKLNHYSDHGGLMDLGIDPAKHGAGVSGQESKRKLSGGPWVNRSYYYLDGTEPEAALATKPFKYTAEIPDHLIYNINADPLGLKAKSKWGESIDLTQLEHNIAQAGFAGYHNPNPNEPQSNVVAVFHKIKPLSVQSPLAKNEVDPWFYKKWNARGLQKAQSTNMEKSAMSPGSTKDTFPKSFNALQVDGDIHNPEVMLHHLKLHEAFALKANNPDSAKYHRDHAKQIGSYLQQKTRPTPQPKQASLEKGLRGDWQKEGYSLTHEQDGDSHEVKAFDPSGNQVGRFMFIYWKAGKQPHLKSAWSEIHDDHQRKGLATAAYQLAEQKSGLKIHPSDVQTGFGEKLWAQPNRTFGEIKKTQPTPESVSQNMKLHQVPLDQQFDNIETFAAAGNLYHHVFTKKMPNGSSSHLHTLSLSDKPWDDHKVLSTMVGGKYGKGPWETAESVTLPALRGKGMGLKLYQEAARYHGAIASDQNLSKPAEQVWKKLATNPEFAVKLSQPKTFDRHVARYLGKPSIPITQWGKGSLRDHYAKQK